MDDVWVLGGEVVEFGSIGGHVVQFPGSVSEGDEFPVFVMNSPIALVLEEECAVPLLLFLKEGNETLANHFKFSCIIHAGGVDDCWH